MRHALEYWIRRQAEEAVELAMGIDEASDAWVCGDPVENALDTDEPGMSDMDKLQYSYAAAAISAGQMLYHMELLHREIERRKA